MSGYKYTLTVCEEHELVQYVSHEGIVWEKKTKDGLVLCDPAPFVLLLTKYYSEAFAGLMIHALDQSRKQHWLNVLAALTKASTIALEELNKHLKAGIELAPISLLRG